MDFCLKIININGMKVRVQLWDSAGGTDPASSFAPLFIRNAVGCVVVANAENAKSLREMTKWRSEFNSYTQMPRQPALPCCFFINHFTQGNIATAIKISD
jgi:GTPase SAR1 family protein